MEPWLIRIWNQQKLCSFLLKKNSLFLMFSSRSFLWATNFDNWIMSTVASELIRITKKNAHFIAIFRSTHKSLHSFIALCIYTIVNSIGCCIQFNLLYYSDQFKLWCIFGTTANTVKWLHNILWHNCCEIIFSLVSNLQASSFVKISF